MEARNLLDKFSQERGIPESQSMDYSLDPRTQTYLRNSFVMQQNPLPSISTFVATRPIPSRPVSLLHHSPQPVHSNRALEVLFPRGIRMELQPGSFQVPQSTANGSQVPNLFQAAVLNSFISPQPVSFSMPPGRTKPLPETSSDEELEGKDGSRTYWHDWKNNLLIEVKKEEIIAQLTRQTNRSKVDRNDSDEWERTRETMASRGVHLKANQLKNKYNNLLSDYRKIRDWNRRSGVQLFWSMMHVDRRKEKLLMKFLEAWFEAIDSTQKDHHVNSPVCLESSSSVPRANNESIPSSPPNPIEGATPFVEARSRAENVDTEKETKTNSGKKWKKNCSKSAMMLVDVLERMAQNNVSVIQEVEKGRIAKEDARNKLLS
ncbi:hypothetical protein R1flu_018594 [Riccia fluitans]|uniref:Myb/SANT-like DNA-binding domain-containing protein n=1 Tax=Riccia fluitans TaxID=41844 RepID=A0ABD1ZIL5_9MARC